MTKAVAAIKNAYDTEFQYGSIANVLCKFVTL